MRRTTCALSLALLAGALGALPAAPAQAGSGPCLTDPPAFGLCELDVSFTDAPPPESEPGTLGAPSMQAGSHPFAFTTRIAVNTKDAGGSEAVPVEEAKDVLTSFPPGLVGNPTAAPRCTAVQFLTGDRGECPDASAIGIARVELGAAPGEEPTLVDSPLYNLYPSPGEAAKFGFLVEGRAPVVIDTEVSPDPPYNLLVPTTNISQAVFFYAATLTVWGVPADPAHDEERGECASTAKTGCAGGPERPFLTLPTRCEGPLAFGFQADSWQHPGAWVTEPPVLTHDDSAPPAPLGTSGCERLGFSPTIAARPTTASSQSASGLDFDLEVNDEGITSPTGIADSQIREATVTLPEGVSLNPSQAEGLGTCTEADLARESAGAAPGSGCPQDSKVGTVEATTPLLEGTTLHGSVYVATPYANLASDSLIAIYVVIRDPELGILLRLAGKVTPDPQSGQLQASFEDLPQLPFERFHLHLRSGGRSPLITPPGCGSFETVAKLTPWADPSSTYTTTASFAITSGPGGSPCPAGAPFAPAFQAASYNDQAGAYSPFFMRLARRDGEQDLGRFSAVLPPGVVGRIAGIPWCPEAGIAQARSRSGPHGGQEELSSPSCPAASQIGRTLAGAGVGTELTYVPGSLYLAGPYRGAPLSVVAIVPALAGPFDAGTVVVREALALDPITAQVGVDGAASDPIPHILKGIPLNVRDLRVFADRAGFTLNPTSCEPFQTLATAWGEGTVLAPTAGAPVGLAAPYQAAGCAGLGFKPKLGIKLKGGTKRGKFPRLRAVYTPRAGNANLARLALLFPRSEFIEQGHFRTICTRVQFAAGAGHGSACPKGSVYGQVRVWTPLLAEPLSGPVYLRSSNHNLPDAVFALHGTFDLEVAVRIDSRKGRLRATVLNAPDAPVSRAIVDMQGAQKGLFVNSTNICKGRNRARANAKGQNGKRRTLRPVVRATKCKRHRKGKKRGKGKS